MDEVMRSQGLAWFGSVSMVETGKKAFTCGWERYVGQGRPNILSTAVVGGLGLGARGWMWAVGVVAK